MPETAEKIEARWTLAEQGKAMTPAQRGELRVKTEADDVLLLLLRRYAPLWLAGLLGAGIMAAVMATDCPDPGPLDHVHEVGSAGLHAVGGGGVVAVSAFQAAVPAPLPGPPKVVWSAGGRELLARMPGGTAVLGFMPVVPMVVVSFLTPKPSAATIARYFPYTDARDRAPAGAEGRIE